MAFYSNQPFTIIYKTYEKDFVWLEYSLLSLQKYLETTNIFEIIFYVKDMDYFLLIDLLQKIKMYDFTQCRVIAVHYDYYGYIKQQVVKANCYKDCVTDYIVILDSDLLLHKPLNLQIFIKENGKIDWKYLKIEDNPNYNVFSTWKTAYEDSTFTPKNFHYMSNGFPFVFTKRSLEAAANKFIEMHYYDYDAYCKIRCEIFHIQINDIASHIFDRMSSVFTEFEYLGFFCHNFSDDYNFIHTPICMMNSQFRKFDTESFFIQNWSHSEITEDIKKNINSIINPEIKQKIIKTIIFAPTYQPCNKKTDDVNNFWGLGDVIRGIISMFQLSKKYDFQLTIDFQHHSFSRFLKSESHQYKNLILENKHNIPFIEDNEIETYLQNNSSEVSYLFTNSHLRGEITEECKEFIKNILTPNEEFQKSIDEKFLNYKIPENYHILHFRLGDSFLIRNQEGDFSNAMNKYHQWRENDDVLISDSLIFKEKIKENHKDIILLNTEPVHLGYANHSNNIKDTLLEFFIITKSKKIKTFSIYDWISGFVNVVHQIYDIPIIRI